MNAFPRDEESVPKPLKHVNLRLMSCYTLDNRKQIPLLGGCGNPEEKNGSWENSEAAG